jgi:murein DD-endopeptidase MepM/ murein hydrolase activator NlpD
MLIVSFYIRSYRYLAAQTDELHELRTVNQEQSASLARLRQQAELLAQRVNRLEEADVSIRELLRSERALPDELMEGLVPARGDPIPARGAPRLFPADDGQGGRSELDQLAWLLGSLQQRVRVHEESLHQLQGLAAEAVEFLRARPSIWPVAGRITSHFGPRRSPVTGLYAVHSGVDIGAAYGAEIRATGDAVVEFAGYNGGLGYCIILDHGYEIKTLYAHNLRNLVCEGDLVQKGQVIALAGSSGVSTGPHLHYEVWVAGERVDPWLYHLADSSPVEDEPWGR